MFCRTNATAQINFRGNWITGPGGYSETELVGQNGSSCNYHASWKFNNESGADFTGNGGPGTYEVDVNGNSQATLTFYVTLTARCPGRGGPAYRSCDRRILLGPVRSPSGQPTSCASAGLSIRRRPERQ